MSIGFSLGVSASRVSAAVAAARIAPQGWTLTDAGEGGTLVARVLAAEDGGARISHYEFRVGDGGWIGFPEASPAEARIAGLTDDAPARVALRAVNALGPGPASDEKTAVPTAAWIADQTLSFGALTTPGAGGARLSAARPVVSVVVLDDASSAPFDVRNGVLTLTGAPVEGATAQVLVNGERTIAVRLTTLAGARSVATIAELSDAIQASARGERVLLRGGDYGIERDAINTAITVGPKTGSFTPAGSSGVVTVEPHPGETPRIWQLNFGRISHVEFRGLTGVCAPNDTFKGAQRAVFWGVESGAGAFVAVRDCTVTGSGVTSVEDGDRLPSGIKFAGDWTDSAILDCVIDTVYDGIGIPGARARVERNVVRSPYNDGVKGGGRFSGLRFLWNRVEKSVKYGRQTAVTSVQFLPGSGAAPLAGAAEADYSRGRLVLGLPAGGAAIFAAKLGAKDGRFGFSRFPAVAGLDAALKAIPPQRNPGDGYDYKTYVDFRAANPLIYDVAADTITFEYDVAAVPDLAALGAIATPGMVFEASNAHADFLQITANTEDAEDAHIIGNVFWSERESLTGARVDNGMMMGAQTDIWWRDCLFAGNIVSQSGKNGMNVKRHDRTFIGLNTCIADPSDPDWLGKTASSCAIQFDLQTSDSSLGDLTRFGNVGRCLTESVAASADRGGRDLGDNRILTTADYGPRGKADAQAWAAAMFEDFPAFAAAEGSHAVADPARLWRPRPGVALAHFGAHARPDLIDHAARTYDPAGLKALRDTMLAPAALTPLAVTPESESAVTLRVATTKGVGAIHSLLTADATPPTPEAVVADGVATPLSAPFAAGEVTLRREALSPGATYHAWLAQRDPLGQISAVAAAGAFTLQGLSAPLTWLGGRRTPDGTAGSVSSFAPAPIGATAGLALLALSARCGNTGRSITGYAVQPLDGSGAAIGPALTATPLVISNASAGRAFAAIHQVALPAGTTAVAVSLGWSGTVRCALDLFMAGPGLGAVAGRAAAAGGGSAAAVAPAAGAHMMMVAACDGANPAAGPLVFDVGAPARSDLDLNAGSGHRAAAATQAGLSAVRATAAGAASVALAVAGVGPV